MTRAESINLSTNRTVNCEYTLIYRQWSNETCSNYDRTFSLHNNRMENNIWTRRRDLVLSNVTKYPLLVYIWWLFRLTLVVDWWFCPKFSAGYLPLSERRLGGDSTWRRWRHLTTILHNQTCLNFLNQGVVGSKNLKFPLGYQLEAIVVQCSRLFTCWQHLKHIWGGDSTWRWWGHLTTILHNRTCFNTFPLICGGEKKNYFVRGQLPEHSGSSSHQVKLFTSYFCSGGFCCLNFAQVLLL